MRIDIYNIARFDEHLYNQIIQIHKTFDKNQFILHNHIIEVIIAVEDDIPVGCLFLSNEDNELLIDNIKVKKRYRMKGIGRSMVSSILFRYKEIIYIISLQKAISFWTSMNFHVYNNRDRFTILMKRDNR